MKPIPSSAEILAKREPYTAADLIDAVLACAEEELKARLSGMESGFEHPDVQVLFGFATGIAMHLHQAPPAETETTLWLCGENPATPQWSFVGVFSTEDKAVENCRTDSFFVAPVVLDAVAPEDNIEFPGCYYPLAQPIDPTP